MKRFVLSVLGLGMVACVQAGAVDLTCESTLGGFTVNDKTEFSLREDNGGGYSLVSIGYYRTSRNEHVMAKDLLCHESSVNPFVRSCWAKSKPTGKPVVSFTQLTRQAVVLDQGGQPSSVEETYGQIEILPSPAYPSLFQTTQPLKNCR